MKCFNLCRTLKGKESENLPELVTRRKALIRPSISTQRSASVHHYHHQHNKSSCNSEKLLENCKRLPQRWWSIASHSIFLINFIKKIPQSISYHRNLASPNCTPLTIHRLHRTSQALNIRTYYIS